MQKSRRACRHGKIRQDSQDTGRKENFKYVFCRDTARRVRRFQQREARWKRSAGTFSKSRNSKRETGRSGLVRSALEKLSLFSPTFSARQEHGAGSFAVCGQRLRGHVPSKNTSPAALSWSSLTGSTAPFLFVPARCFTLSRLAVSANPPQKRGANPKSAPPDKLFSRSHCQKTTRSSTAS